MNCVNCTQSVIVDSIVKPMENELFWQKGWLQMLRNIRKPLYNLSKMWFRVEICSKIADSIVEPMEIYPFLKKVPKICKFYYAARRIWRKRVEKRVQNGSNPYKTNGKPPNEVSWEYFFVWSIFLCIQKKVSHIPMTFTVPLSPLLSKPVHTRNVIVMALCGSPGVTRFQAR